MYAEFFGLAREPFPVTPDPGCLYLGSSHREALAALCYGVDQRRGFIELVGEVGTGKTTLLRAFLGKLDRETHTAIVMLDPNMDFREVLRFMTDEFGIDSEDLAGHALVSRVHGRLLHEYQEGRNVVLVVDEAQNMPVATLERLRLLSNIETDDQKLIQIVLAGQPELDAVLARPELRQIQQRIGVRAELQPLSDSDAHAYLAQHVEAVSGSVDQVFSGGARQLIVDYAQGIPRALNIAADTVLINALGAESRPVSRAVAADALKGLARRRARPAFGGWQAAAALASVALVAAAGWSYFGGSLAESDDGGIAADTPPVSAPEALPKPALATPAPMQFDALAIDRSLSLQRVPERMTVPASTPASQSAHAAAEPPPVVMPMQPAAPASVLARTHRNRIKWDPTPLPDEYFPVQHEVVRGDIISQLCLDIYGFAGPELYAFLTSHHDELFDVDALEPGQVIAFPALTAQLQDIRSAYVRDKPRPGRSAAVIPERRP